MTAALFDGSGDGIDDTEVATLKSLTFIIIGCCLVFFWCLLVILDLPGVLWDEGGQVLLPLYEESIMNPLLQGMGFLGFGAVQKPKTRQVELID